MPVNPLSPTRNADFKIQSPNDQSDIMQVVNPAGGIVYGGFDYQGNPFGTFAGGGGGGAVASVFGRAGVVTAQTGDYSFSQISGTVAAAQLPNPGVSSLGGVESFTAVAHNFLTQISTSGVVSAAQPSFSDISSQLAISQINAT